MLSQMATLAQETAIKTKSGIIIETTEYVDLGLPSGTLWASCNIGASKPEEKGNYYAWGEVSTKSEFYWDNYFDTKNYEFSSNKYIEGIESGKEDFKKFYSVYGDTTIVGNMFYDVATLKKGRPWHTPTLKQYKELYDESTMIPDFYHGVYGMAVIGPNKKAIFLPSTSGIIGSEPLKNGKNAGRYWLSDLTSFFPDHAYCFGFNANDTNLFWDKFYRCVGFAVRPVADM